MVSRQLWARKPSKRPYQASEIITTRRDKIIAFYGCFHGRTLGALFAHGVQGRVQRKGFGEALLAGVRFSESPIRNSYRCLYGQSVALHLR